MRRLQFAVIPAKAGIQIRASNGGGLVASINRAKRLWIPAFAGMTTRRRRDPDDVAMRKKQLKFGEGFRVAFDVRRAQAAEMVIAPGDAEGGDDNRHRGADQWLFVVAGRGQATVEVDGRKRRVALAPGTLLVIEKGERHEVRNTGRTLLKTLNFYYPPAFAKDGDPKGPGRK